MKKKKFDLSKDMISIEYTNNLQELSSSSARVKKESDKKVKLTLSVPPMFVKEFKSWCVKNDTTMSDSLIDAFALLKNKQNP